MLYGSLVSSSSSSLNFIGAEGGGGFFESTFGLGGGAFFCSTMAGDFSGSLATKIFSHDLQRSFFPIVASGTFILVPQSGQLITIISAMTVSSLKGTFSPVM